MKDYYVDAKIIKAYEQNYRKYGREHPKSYLVPSWDKMMINHYQLLEHVTIDGKTVIDVGCGYCEFLKYAVNVRRQFPKRYVGIDLLPEFIVEASKTLDDIESDDRLWVSLDVMDVFSTEFQIRVCSADVVIASGVASAVTNIDKLIDVLWQKVSPGGKMIFNSLSTVGYTGRLRAYSPVKTLETCLTYTDKVRLIHDYGDFRFLVVMEKGLDDA